MAIYTLRVLIANTFPQVRKIANALKSDHKVVYRKGQTVIFSFDSECNLVISRSIWKVATGAKRTGCRQ